VKEAILFTRRFPVLQRRSFFSGRDVNRDNRPDIKWYADDGGEPRWGDPNCRTIAYQLDGAEADTGSGDYLVFVILNASWNVHRVSLPDPGASRRWYRVVDTSLEDGKDFLAEGKEVALDPSDHYVAANRSTVVLLAR
jgi:isoamylase